MEQAAENVAAVTAEKFTLKGPTLQLSRSVRGFARKKRGFSVRTRIVGVITASAKNDKGFDYAELRPVRFVPLVEGLGQD